MEIVREYCIIKDFVGECALTTPEFFIAQRAKEWGYFVHERKILPFYIKKKFVFTYMLFTTKVWGVYDRVEEEQFLNDMIAYVRKRMQVDFILSQHVTALFNAYPSGAQYCRFGSHILDLSLDVDDLFAKMHVKHRNVVRKAIKENVVVSCDLSNKERCIAVVQDTLKRQNIGIVDPQIINCLDDICNVDYWISECDGVVEGAAILLWSAGGYAYYMYGGSSPSPHAGGMNLLQWEVICKMKDRGVRYYDFVGARIDPEKGSKYEGIQRFKERFGGILHQGYLWKMPLNRFKYILYQLVLYLRTRGNYRGDVIDQERNRGN